MCQPTDFSAALKEAYGIDADEAGLTVDEAERWCEGFETGREAAHEYGRKYDLTLVNEMTLEEAEHLMRRFK